MINKLLFPTLILFSISMQVSAKQTISTYLPLIQQNEITNCKIDSLALATVDLDFRKKLNSHLNAFGSMNYRDFDVGKCVTNLNIQNNIVTSEFEQINKTSVGHHLTAFTAYNLKNKDLMVVIVDGNLKTYIVGQDTLELRSALKNSFIDNQKFQKVDFDSKLKFSDMSDSPQAIEKKSALIKSVQDTELKNKKILETAKINAAKNGNKNLLKSDTSFEKIIKDGDKKDIKVNVYIKTDKNINIPLVKSEVEKNLNFASQMIQMKLKNPYSYKPREILVKQDNLKAEYIIKYTAKNSYGGEVVGIDGYTFYLQEDGKYHPQK
jgi:hypothetical protein